MPVIQPQSQEHYNMLSLNEIRNPGKSKIATVEKAAQTELGARTESQNATLADLYDPNTMPPVLLKAHKPLDKAVDTAYGRTNFAAELERMEFSFRTYKGLVDV